VKIAVVASGYGNPWSEEHLLTRRLAGTLACLVDVDLLLPGDGRAVEHDGAVRLLRFPATPVDPPRREAWRRAMLGAAGAARLSDRGAPPVLRARELPEFAEKELLFSTGGYSPELYEHLREGRYDLVAVVGYHSPGAYWGVGPLDDDQRIVLVPAVTNTATLGLRVHDEVFDRAERILVCSERERRAVAARIGSNRPDRIENIGFLVGVNAFARKTEPFDWSRGDWVVAIGNWFESPAESVTEWADELEERHGLAMRLVGPGAERFRHGAVRSASRLDIWRWVCRAVAVFDPTPNRLLGRDVLESMLYGTPVIVHAQGGANQEHAELADGGLWYRTREEFLAVAAALREPDTREALSSQGHSYAERHFADPDRFIKRIAELIID
jgi:hypothetical protein